MWQLLPLRLQVLTITAAALLVVTGIQSAIAILGGQPGTPLQWTTLAAFIVGTVLFSLAQALWFTLLRAWPWLQSKTFPDLNGTWTGTLRSTWIDPATNQGTPLIKATIDIRLTLLTVSVALRTKESGSISIREILEASYKSRRFQIWYAYKNDPDPKVRPRSQPHDGVALLEMDWNADRNRLTGRYYTERETSGHIDVKRS